MLASCTTLYLHNGKTYYFYKEEQPLFKKMAGKFKTEYIPFLRFEMIKKVNNCSLVFGDSCEEIYQIEDFVKIAVAGRHKQIHCLFVKGNLFHQSKWSRTIDLNTTHCPFRISTRRSTDRCFWLTVEHQRIHKKFLQESNFRTIWSSTH